jgi:hypothetical protein
VVQITVAYGCIETEEVEENRSGRESEPAKEGQCIILPRTTQVGSGQVKGNGYSSPSQVSQSASEVGVELAVPRAIEGG